MEDRHVNLPPPCHERVLGGQGWIGLIDRMGSEVSIVNAARVSFGKRRETMDEDDVKLLRYLLSHRHSSPFEHVTFTFIVHCPLFVRAQWHRHRMWSYNEISRRYTSVDLQFYTPPAVREQAEDNRQASRPTDNLDQEGALRLIRRHNEQSLELYRTLRTRGVCREQARGVLPQTMMTTFWATVDLHNLIHFLDLRDSDHAQWEIREYAAAIKRLLRPHLPHVADVLDW